MKHLTEKELAFWNALLKDYETNTGKSFIEILFQGGLVPTEEMREELEELFEGSYHKLFNESDLLMESVQLCYIGKYKDFFWGTGSEGEIFGMGKEIQNIAFPIIFSELGNVTEPDEKKSVCEYFTNHLKLDYDKYIQKYRDFCRSFGFEYKEDLDLIEKQSEEFNELLDNLE